MSFHQHIATVPHYISAQICSAIAVGVESANMTQQGTIEVIDGLPTGSLLYDNDVRNVLSGTDFKQPELIHSVLQTIVTHYIEPEFLCNVKCWESPQLLLYPEDGGHYKAHADSDKLNSDGIWERVTNRHLSVLLYLDEDYEGGELSFPQYNVTMRPTIGQIVVFPSNHYFIHSVAPLIKGTRRVLVCWMTIYGQPTMSPIVSDQVSYNGQYSAISI
jgi:2OG-Fe(II) oxygenase superfamily